MNDLTEHEADTGSADVQIGGSQVRMAAASHVSPFEHRLEAHDFTAERERVQAVPAVVAPDVDDGAAACAAGPRRVVPR
eukprot:scaffold32814_cov68-Phaeocystis_antarctica.AAC.4